MTTASRWGRGALLALAVAAVGGCSLTLDFDAECGVDDDCTDGRVCSEGFCVLPGGSSKPVAAQDLLKAPCTQFRSVQFEDPSQPVPDNVILIGTILPKSGQLAVYGGPIDDAVALAFKEINQAGGLFGKKLGVLSCDSGTDPAVAAQAAEHLANVAKVPAIIGPAASGVTIEVFNQVTHDAGVLTISPAATSPAITGLSDDGLLWRTAPSDAVQGQAIAALLLDRGYSKIAVINRDDAYGQGLRNAIQADLCGSFACNDDKTYFSRSYDDEAFTTAHGNIILELQEFAPDVVVLIAFPEDGANFLNLASSANIKQFVLTDGMKSDDLDTVVDDTELLCRVIGTQPAAPTGQNYLVFELSFKSEYSRQPGAFSANAYDAAYLIGYSIAANGSSPVTGANLATAMQRLSSGALVPTGSLEWNQWSQHLASGPEQTIDYDGASGKLDFDANGEAASSIEGWVFDTDDGETQSLGVLLTADGAYTAPAVDDPDVPGLGAACAPFRSAP